MGPEGIVDFKLRMNLEGLERLLVERCGDSFAAQAWVKAVLAALGEDYCVNTILLRRSSAVGQHINFHLDRSIHTLQLSPNGDDEFEGG